MPKDPERVWMRLGATRVQARRLNAIPIDRAYRITYDDLKSGRATNMWPCALRWLDDGEAVIDNGEMFVRIDREAQL